MKYKKGDILKNLKTGKKRMIEGMGWGFGKIEKETGKPEFYNEGYVIDVFFGGCHIWQDDEVELVMTAEELKKKIGRIPNANDAKDLVGIVD